MTHHLDRLTKRSLLLLAALGACASLLAQGPLQMDPVVTTATRTPESLTTVGSDVEVVTQSDMEREQLSTIADALSGMAAAPIFGTGQKGASDSLFLRGADSDQVLFLVDGIRMNDANTDYGPFIAGARLGGLSDIEVAYGPQSTLYGAEAIGGVVAVNSQKGSGAPTSDISFEAGSFGTIEGGLAAQGSVNAWAYNVSLDGGKTENDRPSDAFSSLDFVARIDREVTPTIDVGATLRTYIARTDDPSDIYTNSIGDYEDEDNWLGTLFASMKIAPDWTAKLTLGGQDRRYYSVEPTLDEPGDVSVVQNRRGVIDFQTTYSGIDSQKITVGFTAEDETTTNNGFGSIDQRQNLFAVFGQDEWKVADTAYLTGGLRYDDFDTFGSALTGRITAAWLVAGNRIKLHSSYGTGFHAPSFLDLYGQSPYYVGNPSLKPEKARGWDAGFDYYLPAHMGTLSATWFRTDYTDLIEYNFNLYPSTVENIEKARTDGVEFTGKFNLAEGLIGSVSYTYLDANDLTDGVQLLRRPRNSGSADISKTYESVFTLGAGVQVVGERMDVSALTYEDIEDPSYSVFRVYAAYKATSALTLKLRIENALDRHYAPINGYPALPLGVFGGIDYKF